MTDSVSDPRAHRAARWEARYAATTRLWSGRPNEWLESIAGDWEPGRVLDIGCGEGADLLWFVRQGWEGVGIDFSSTAIERLNEGARELGLSDRVRGVSGDAASTRVDGLFDLVTVFFVHGGPDGDGMELPDLLAAQVERLAPSGRLFCAVHAINPPWHKHNATTYRAAELLAALPFVDASWTVEVAEERWKDIPATADHEAGRRADAVLVLTRETRPVSA